MSRLENIRANSEAALDAPKVLATLDDGKAPVKKAVIPEGNITDANDEISAPKVTHNGKAPSADDLNDLTEDELEQAQQRQIDKTNARDEKRKANVLDPNKLPVAEVESVTQRTYVLRQGKGQTFPVVYPTGHVVYVEFANGTKTLSGRLMELFHAEYLSNPNMRMHVSEVDMRAADAVAASYLADRKLAHGGAASAPTSPLNSRASRDGFTRALQQQASNQGANGGVTEHDLLRNMVTEGGHSVG